jgi:hypothetical protein
MMLSQSRYPLVSVRNLPAYGAVMATWAGASALLALVLRATTDGTVGFLAALAFAGVAVLTGMAIMFGASAVNLRKLRPGFERLADGARDPAIPAVWCPVLTMATRSAVELSEKVRSGDARAAEGEGRP